MKEVIGKLGELIKLSYYNSLGRYKELSRIQEFLVAGSQHVYWKHQKNHSSNKLNKGNSQGSKRAKYRKIITIYDNNLIELDPLILPKYGSSGYGGICSDLIMEH